MFRLLDMASVVGLGDLGCLSSVHVGCWMQERTKSWGLSVVSSALQITSEHMVAFPRTFGRGRS